MLNLLQETEFLYLMQTSLLHCTKALSAMRFFEKICTLDELKNPVYMLAFWMHDSKIPQFAKLLKALGTDSEFNCFRGYKYSYEITPKSANKGTAAAKLKSMTNATRLFTVGDNENDLSLIDAADVSFAPKNAIELIKSVADVQLKKLCGRLDFSPR